MFICVIVMIILVYSSVVIVFKSVLNNKTLVHIISVTLPTMSVYLFVDRCYKIN